MKITYHWLKGFVEIKITPSALAEKLTMAGLEVTSLEERDGDFVFEIEVTANRPDCLSVVGIAREVAAITGKRLTRCLVNSLSRSNEKTKKRKNEITINIQDKNDCPLYTAKIIKDVKVGSSPDWLKKRLELVGVRSVNNIVDIANYILFTYGEPLHAFDLGKLSGDRIIIRRGKPQEKITTIDNLQRILNPGILVIADKDHPVAIAGIMGGKDTEVTAATKDILLEAALFNPTVIRRARGNLGLQSESSYRFERGVDLETVENASWQAAALIQELTGARCVSCQRSGLPKTKKRSINLDVAAAQKTLGVNIAAAKIKKILNSLAFKTKAKTKNNFSVEIPAHRPDVNLEIDLIEEIARIHGYALIPKTSPAVKPQVSAGKEREVSLIKEALAGLGLNEVITYSLIDREWLKDSEWESAPEIIEILNPLSKEQEVLRPTLMPSLLRCVALNLNQKQGYINIFEIAKVFAQEKGGRAKEELVLGIALCGIKSLLLGQGLVREEAGFLHLKGIIETLFARLGIKDYSFNSGSRPSEVAVFIGKEKIGSLRQAQRSVLERAQIKNKDVFMLEISLERVCSGVDLQTRFAPLPLYPAMARDISLILKEEVRVKDILETIKAEAGPLLREVKIIDYYKGKQIPAGFKSLTVSCIYRGDARTLTEAEINPAQAAVLNVLMEKFGAKIR